MMCRKIRSHLLADGVDATAEELQRRVGSPQLNKPCRTYAEFLRQELGQKRGPHLGIDLADQTEACRPDMAMPEPDPELRPFWQRLRRMWRAR